MKKRMTAVLLLCAALALGGCKKEETETGQVEIPQVQTVEEPVRNQTEEQREAELGIGTEAGTVLGEEEVTVMLEGVPESAMYTRIQGNGDFSIAYDAEHFVPRTEGERLYLDSAAFTGTDGKPAVFIRIEKSETDSLEALVDKYVYESNEECTVEEVTVGEGEYPATWIGYAEGTDGASRTCDLYVLRINGVPYTIQLDCFLEATEGLGGMQQMILSTLRVSEG